MGSDRLLGASSGVSQGPNTHHQAGNKEKSVVLVVTVPTVSGWSTSRSKDVPTVEDGRAKVAREVSVRCAGSS